jgi:general secretion pathway protein G
MRERIRRFWRDESGFSLVEMLVVVAIMAALLAVIGPQFFGRVDEAKVVSAKNQMKNLAMALDLYRMDNNAYPSTDQGLAALTAAPSIPPFPSNWRGPYLEGEVPKDPWGSPYVYRSPGEQNPGGYDLLSYGRDGKPGGEKEDQDITSR